MRVSTADRLLGLPVRIPPGPWIFVRCECCVWSGRGLCDGPITRPEESYRLWYVIYKPQTMRRPRPTLGCCARNNNNNNKFIYLLICSLLNQAVRNWSYKASNDEWWAIVIMKWEESGRIWSFVDVRQTRLCLERLKLVWLDGQCTYNVTVRHVRQSLLPWESNLCMCACVYPGARACECAYNLANPACSACAPYCDVICGPPFLHHIFRNYLIKGAIFGKKRLLNIKYVFWFFLQLFSETCSHSRKNLARYV
jgi:hypothetical protein